MTTAPSPIRILVADDQPLVRVGFRQIVDARSDLQFVGEADNGAGAVELTAQLGPDVVLMDIRMPIMDGIEATRLIRADVTPTTARVLILTTFDLDEYVYAALRAGASGFLLKDAPPETLAAAIRTVMTGTSLFAPTITARLVERYAGRIPSHTTETAALRRLTDREREVLGHIARGLSNAQIAQQLIISEATVKSHVARVLMKLDLHDRVQAVVYAYETGFVQPGQEPRRPH